MVKRTAREKHVWFIQVFDNGKSNPPTRKYKLKEYTISEGLIDVADPTTHLIKSIPVNDCSIDEVKE